MPNIEMKEVELGAPDTIEGHVHMLYEVIGKIMQHNDGAAVGVLSVPMNLTVAHARLFTEAVMRGVSYSLATDVAYEQLKEIADKNNIAVFNTKDEADKEAKKHASK